MMPMNLLVFALLLFACVNSSIRQADAPSLSSKPTAAADRSPNVSSGFTALIEGSDAFNARVALADSARRSLDIQYYIWHRDRSGRALLARIIDAAERGVPVRLLLDDMNQGDDREFLEKIDLHPQIEIKLFNPAQADAKGLSTVARGLELVARYELMNRRMHNKVFLADESLAIIGGRNIGDEYFDWNEERNFRDIDLFCEGAISKKLSQVFEEYWNSPWASGIQSPGQASRVENPKEWAKLRRSLDLESKSDPKALAASLEKYRRRLIWATAEAVYDSPDVLHTEKAQELEDQLSRWPEPKEEFLIESAYFIPPEKLLKHFKALKAKGVSIKILTNSLRSNDVLLAHAGYAAKREEILGLGVEVYEWRNSLVKGKAGSRSAYASRASLHSKTFVIDRQYVFIGSMNFDPRSIDLNTESGVMIKSHEIARQIARFIEKGMAANLSWKLKLTCPEEGCDDATKSVEWRGEKDGKDVATDAEPNTSFWKRLFVKILSWMPIEDKL